MQLPKDSGQFAHLGFNDRMQALTSPLNRRTISANDIDWSNADVPRGVLNSTGISPELYAKTLRGTDGVAIVDEYGLVNSTQVTNSAVSTDGGWSQIIGTANTSLEDGTITFVLQRPVTILFTADFAYSFEGTTSALPWYSTLYCYMTLDGSFLTGRTVDGGMTSVMGTAGTTGYYAPTGGYASYLSFSLTWVESNITAGTHNYVLKANSDYIVPSSNGENGIVDHFTQTMLKVGY